MKELKGYITLQRQTLQSEWWLAATGEQVKAYLDLFRVVSFEENDYRCKYGVVHLMKGQMVTSVRQLSKLWHCTLGKANSILNFLVSSGLVSKFVEKREGERISKQYTVLTINSLCVCSERSGKRVAVQEEINKNKKEVKEENIIPPNPQKGETGGDIFSEFVNSENKKSRNSQAQPSRDPSVATTRSPQKSSKEKIKERYMELDKKWKGYISDGKVMKVDGRPFDNQEQFMRYLPSSQTSLGNNSVMLKKMNSEAGFPLVRDMNATQRIEFVELHFCHFLTVCHIHNDMQQEEITYLAYDLSVRCAPLNLPQVSYFFYCMLTSESNIGSPNWNTLSSQKINGAFKKFLLWAGLQ